MDGLTTGETVSRLAVLTVLVTNRVEDNRLTGESRRKAQTEMLGIVNGTRGTDVAKVARRCEERCLTGVWN